MTLFRQISFLVISLIFLLLLGTLTVSIYNTRAFLQDQLYSHAQDTATSLGLSVTPSVNKADWAKVQTMVDAIFDRGYYKSIVLEDIQGHRLIERTSPLKLDGVPSWFVNHVRLNTPRGQTEIMHGWRRAGTLWVESHPGYAYLDLWRITQQGIIWFVLVGGITLAVLIYMLRAVLRPLKEVEMQAGAICEKDFSVQQPLPRTRELRRVVQAMNRMTRQLKVVFDEQVSMIEQVRHQAYEDPVTGLGNELFFNSHFQARLEAPEESVNGAVLILKLKDFQSYNEKYGRATGDLLLKQVAGRWQKVLEEVQGSVIAKRSGADFIAFLPNVTADESEYYLDNVYAFVAGLPLFAQKEKQNILHVGLAHCDVGEDPSELINNADEALRAAQARGDNGTFILKLKQKNLVEHRGQNVEITTHEIAKPQPHTGTQSTISHMSNKEWRELLIRHLKDRSLALNFQPVLSGLDNQVIYHEVLLRMNIQGKLISASEFMPLVERFGLEEAYDRLIVELVMRRLMQETKMQTVYCINLSPHSLQVEGFVEWLLDEVKEHEVFAHRLIFEIPEYSLSYAAAKIQTLATGLREFGSKLSIDHFGAVNKSFAYLSSLPLYAIKIDHSYIRDLEVNTDHQFFVQSLLRIAHSRDILMMAESVETQAQWELLKKFQVDGAQGYFLGRPSAAPVEELELAYS